MPKTSAQPQSLSPDATTRVALLVEYCGADFNGCQFQPDQPTLQSAIEAALSSLNLETSRISFAGRTDAGVHAKGQVAHFDVAPEDLVNIPDLRVALNVKLPDSIAVRELKLDAGRGFHSRREARAKWYRYEIYNAPQRSVWAGADAAHIRKPLDEKRMAQAAQLLLGTHDFESFKCPNTNVVDNVCTVFAADLRRENDRIIFDVMADRFLYKMVRNITGALIAIGRDGMKPESILEMLAKNDRTEVPAIAPPEGLSLMAAAYDAPHNFFDTDLNVQNLKLTLKNRMESQNENLFRKAS